MMGNTFYKIRAGAAGMLLLFLLSVGVAAADPPSNMGPFLDVPPESPFALPLTSLKDKNLIREFSDDHFYPNRKITRAEALALIMRATGTEPDMQDDLVLHFETPSTFTVNNAATGETTTFENVSRFSLSQTKGSYAMRAGENAPKGANRAGAEDAPKGANRAGAEDAPKGANRAGGEEQAKTPFEDVREKDWFFEYAAEAKRRGIVTGKKNGKYFRPKSPVNLAETLRMLFKAKGIQTEMAGAPVPEGIHQETWYAKDIAYAASRTIIAQQPDGKIFPPSKYLTRGQFALLLYRFLQTEEGATFGYASWYADGLAKTKITEGLEYKEKNLTAAHRTLPFGTIISITNVINGKSVNAVVNDRGPFVTGRIVDLSKSAFSTLESTTAGLVQVEVKVLR